MSKLKDEGYPLLGKLLVTRGGATLIYIHIYLYVLIGMKVS
jgi:hypothetical protein